MQRAKQFALIALAAGLTPLHAGVVSYTVTMDSVSTDWLGSGSLNLNSDSFSSSTAYPKFNGDFTSNNQLSITIAAPAGKQFDVLAPPPGAFPGGLNLLVFSDSFVNGGVFVPGDSVTFTGASAAFPAATNFLMQVDNAGRFDIQALEPILGAYSFQSVTFLMDMPGGYNRVFSNFDLTLVALDADMYTPAPGIAPQFAFIDDIPNNTPGVPEPSTWLLMATSAAGLFHFRRKLGRR